MAIDCEACGGGVYVLTYTYDCDVNKGCCWTPEANSSSGICFIIVDEAWSFLKATKKQLNVRDETCTATEGF